MWAEVTTRLFDHGAQIAYGGNSKKSGLTTVPKQILAARPQTLLRGRAIWLIAVHDEGPGITAEDLTRLFQPFQRLASTRQIGGTGLGLAITKGIIEQHGGSIAVSTRPGAGATFTISLPRASV